eukprot:CAMPEP_0119150178 /NCGR_PEP_ID=MMETSP1310-20130426/44395_1 /TAXON_ID=464262 /ORGANISM="Genus nov. species nov., Strain RCC2339" /LENGTH=89 /DNA_ID=CAMNT_0007142329 /DNA_START=48 /DNA_END=314 /DNA_ORIENTATION=+
MYPEGGKELSMAAQLFAYVRELQWDLDFMELAMMVRTFTALFGNIGNLENVAGVNVQRKQQQHFFALFAELPRPLLQRVLKVTKDGSFL